MLEEFGFPRNLGASDPSAPTTCRDRYYAFVYEQIERSIGCTDPLVGSNAWAFGGCGRPRHADYTWHPGDTSYTGDPAHEPQGQNSIFDSDTSTLAIIEGHADRLVRRKRLV